MEFLTQMLQKNLLRMAIAIIPLMKFNEVIII